MRAFRVRLIAVIAVLIVVVGVLSAVVYARGPHLNAVQLDTAQLVHRPDQQVRFSLDESVASVRATQVSVSPAAATSVTTNGKVVSVQFSRALDANTRYLVRVAGVTSSYGGVGTELRYAFRTPRLSYYVLHRAADVDSITRYSVGGGSSKVMYSSAGIQQFAVVGSVLAVVSEDANGDSQLTFLDSDGTLIPLDLPGSGIIESLHADADTGALGFTFTSTGASPQYSDALFLVDFANNVPVALSVGGTQLQTGGWDFVPGTGDVLVLSTNGGLLDVDPTNPNSATPLGNYLALDAVSGDGAHATVTDATGTLVVDLASGTAKRLTPTAVSGVTPYGGFAVPLTATDRVQKIETVDPTTQQYRGSVVRDTGRSSTELYRAAGDAASISALSVSPNGQYVAITAGSGPTDGYRIDAQPTDVATVLVDARTGAVVATRFGFDLGW